jgi:hypothetical protein
VDQRQRRARAAETEILAGADPRAGRLRTVAPAAAFFHDRHRKLDRMHSRTERRVRARIDGAGVDPQPQGRPLLLREFRVVMGSVQILEQPAGGAAQRPRRTVAVQLVAAVRNQAMLQQGPIADREQRRVIAAQIDLAVHAVRVVAAHAVPVQDGLDVAREIHHVGKIVEGFDSPRRSGQQRRTGRLRQRRPQTRFVAAHAADGFARRDAHKALHPLHRQIMFVQRDKKQRSHRRHFEIGRSVRLDRHRAQDPGQRERASCAGRPHAAREVGRLGQLLQNQQPLDLAASHALHVPALVDVAQQQPARAAVRVDARRDRRLARPRRQRTWFVAVQAVARERRAVDQLGGSLPVHQVQAAVVGHQKAIFGQSVRIAEELPRPAHAPRRPEVIRSSPRIDHRHRTHVLQPAMSRRK